VNCKQPHISTSGQCPIRTLAMEKKKAILEARILRQVQTTVPEAKIGDVHKQVAHAEIDSGEGVPDYDGARSYARAVIVGSEGETQTVVNLPPKGRLMRKRNRKVPKRSHVPRRQSVGQVSSIKHVLQKLIQVIQFVCPAAVQPLRQLIKIIEPLLQVAMAMPSSPLKNYNGQ